MAYIDNYVTPGNPVVDITNSLLGVTATYIVQGQTTPTTHPLSSFQAPPPATAKLLATPLSQTFDNQWAVAVNPKTGLTTHDAVAKQIAANIAAQSPKGHSAYNVNVTNLPKTGILRAIVLSSHPAHPTTEIFMSYELKGITATWAAHNTSIIVGDATFQLTFDVAVLVHITIPATASPNFPFAISINVSGARIQSTNFSGDIIDAVGDIENFFNKQPPIFQAAEGTIDSQGGSVGMDFSPFSALVDSIGAAWVQVRGFGFTTLDAVIQPQAPYPEQLILQFVHPQDTAPTFFNPQLPSLFGSVLSTDPAPRAGSTINVLGSYFPLPQSTSLYIGWNDTTSGSVVKSIVQWRQVRLRALPANSVVPRNGDHDGKNTFYAIKNLSPGKQYDITVQDQDMFTETPFSSPSLRLTTTTTDVIELVLTLGSSTWNVGSTTLTSTRNFSKLVKLPGTLATGTYQLGATLAGVEQASTTLVITGAGQQSTPHLFVQGTPINPTTGLSDTTAITAGKQLALELVEFSPGTVKIYINSPSGILLVTTTSPGLGAFTANVVWPTIGGEPVGGVRLFAQGANPTQTAEAPVLVEAQPQQWGI